MWSLGAGGVNRFGGLVTRREILRLGSIGLGGLSLPLLWHLERAQGDASPAPGLPRKARSVIILFLSGGPAHQDMWDMKPDAPVEVRGTFRPIATGTPGISITEHMPRMARLSRHYAIVRSMTHAQSNHPAAAYWMMTGSPIQRPANEAGAMSRFDRPHPGSALAQVLGPTGGVPPFVLLPEAMQPNGPERAGQHAGFLGAAFDPYRINSDPNLPGYTPGALQVPADLTMQRLGRRRSLLGALDGHAESHSSATEPEDFEEYHARAFDLLASSAARRAFQLDDEPAAVRDRYGRHVFGQSVLLARRMVEAGVRLVQVNWVRHDNGKGGQGYDSHRNHLDWARNELLPPTDAAFASLIEDLDARGRLDETLVIMMGEFGRTPRFNNEGGRDHWPHCFSVVLAGGGIQGEQVLGASDKIGAYPTTDPVTPGDLMATLYHCLGVDPSTLIHDIQDRPYVLANGRPLDELL